MPRATGSPRNLKKLFTHMETISVFAQNAGMKSQWRLAFNAMNRSVLSAGHRW